MSPLKISISTWAFSSYPLRYNFELPLKLGFKNIEFNPLCIEREANESIETVKGLIEYYGLKCLSMHSAGIYVTSKEEIDKAIHYGELSVKFASYLSSPILVVHSYVSNKLKKEKKKLFLSKIFQKILDVSDAYGVEVTLENLSRRSSGYGRNIQEIGDILGTIQNDLSLTLDISHLNNWREAASYVENFKIKNLHVSQRDHQPLDSASHELSALIRELYAREFRGPVTIELRPDVSLKDIKKTKKLLEEVVCKALNVFKGKQKVFFRV